MGLVACLSESEEEGLSAQQLSNNVKTFSDLCNYGFLGMAKVEDG